MIEERLREALEDMVWHFAYDGQKDGKFILWTGGLSALENAFDALGWSNPKYFEDNDSMDGVTCDVEACVGRVVAQGGMWRETGYWCLCAKHSKAYRDGKVQPKMKERAINREAKRDPITRCLPLDNK